MEGFSVAFRTFTDDLAERFLKPLKFFSCLAVHNNEFCIIYLFNCTYLYNLHISNNLFVNKCYVHSCMNGNFIFMCTTYIKGVHTK